MKRLPALDGLRGLAAFWVMFVHYSNLHPAFGQAPLNSAHLGVMIFFVLSGFLMAELTLRRSPTALDTVGFYVRRFARVVPLWLLVVFISALTVAYAPHWQWFWYFTKDSSLLKNLLLQDGPSVLWTLAVELRFYILWPVLWSLMAGLGQPGKWIPVLLIVYLFNGGGDQMSPDVSTLLFTQVGAYFLVGVAVSVWLPRKSSVLFDVLPFLVIGLFVWALLNRPDPSVLYMWPKWPFLMASTLALIAALNGPLTIRLLSFSPIRFLGMISYSLYLLHMPVMWYWRRFTQIDETMPDIIVWCVTVATTLAVATGVYYAVENPARKLINGGFRKLSGRRPKDLSGQPVDRPVKI